MKNAFAGLLVAVAVAAVAIPSFGCGGGTSVSMFVDTQVEQPSLPPTEVFNTQPSRNTLEVM
jgi:hypothetical protein